jgi:hypothetical protein
MKFFGYKDKKQLADENLSEGETFLAENGKKRGRGYAAERLTV